MIWYNHNKTRALEWQREYRKRKHNSILENRRRYDAENHQHLLELKKQWRKGVGKEKNRISKQKTDKTYYAKNKNNMLFLEKKHQRDKIYSKRPEVRKRSNMLAKIRRKENPRSARRQHDSIDLQIAMNNVRKRDHNTCQWQGCGLTFRQSPIHVHHIFPRSEYPDFAEIEQYMIGYCANHHGLWHRFRGDSYSEMILARYQENGILSNEVIY